MDCFCEYCFEDENIKQYIRDNGELIEKKIDCSFCHLEIDELKYIITQEEFIQKLREVIFKLYTYDWDNVYDNICRDATLNYCEGDESPEQYADLIDLNTLEGIDNKEEYYFSSLEEILENFKIDFDDDFEEIFTSYIVTSSESHIAYTEGGELKDWNNDRKLWKYNCLYSTEEYKIGNWENFREHTKHKERYFEHKDNKFSVIKTLNNFDNFFKCMTIEDKRNIYRARQIKSQEEKSIIEENQSGELGKAPVKIVKNNRFSPIGISYGYFAFDKQTALAEIRASKNDEVAIAKFQLDKSLKLIDFRKKSIKKYTNPFLSTFNINVYCESFMINEFIKDISKPVSDDDTELEYIATQIMAEYIWSIGYHGFIFDSSQNKNGENIVLFGENPKYNNFEFINIIEKNFKYIFEEIK